MRFCVDPSPRTTKSLFNHILYTTEIIIIATNNFTKKRPFCDCTESIQSKPREYLNLEQLNRYLCFGWELLYVLFQFSLWCEKTCVKSHDFRIEMHHRILFHQTLLKTIYFMIEKNALPLQASTRYARKKNSNQFVRNSLFLCVCLVREERARTTKRVLFIRNCSVLCSPLLFLCRQS